MKKLLQVHKWLGLIVLIQLLLWLISGLVLSLIDFNKSGGRIYQENIVHPKTPFPSSFVVNSKLMGNISDTFNSEKVDTIKLVSLHGQWFYQVQMSNKVKLFDSRKGELMFFDDIFAVTQAKDSYKGTGALVDIEELPEGTLSRWRDNGKLWQVRFDDDIATRVIVSQSTGKVLRHMNNFTSLSELMFLLHFMDYQKQHSFNHWWIVMFALLAVAFSVSGVILLFHHYRRTYRRLFV